MKIQISEAQNPDGSKGYLIDISNAGEVNALVICATIKEVESCVAAAMLGWRVIETAE